MTLISQRPLSSSTEKIGATKASLSSRSLTALRTTAGTYVVPHPWRFATQLYPNLGLVLAAVPPSSASDSFLPPPCRLRRWAAKSNSHIRELFASYPFTARITIVNRKLYLTHAPTWPLWASHALTALRRRMPYAAQTSFAARCCPPLRFSSPSPRKARHTHRQLYARDGGGGQRARKTCGCGAR
jgi:hypothetical protein